MPRLVVPQTLMKIGSSFAVVLPPRWFKAHRIDPRKTPWLYVGCDRDLTVFNPGDAARFEKFVDARTMRMRRRLLRSRKKSQGGERVV